MLCFEVYDSQVLPKVRYVCLCVAEAGGITGEPSGNLETIYEYFLGALC